MFVEYILDYAFVFRMAATRNPTLSGKEGKKELAWRWRDTVGWIAQS
jgi:hypothetical protein